MNYLVLPTPLLKRWREAFASSYSPVPWLNQQVLARFMTDGSWGRHLRRVQTRNRRKYDALTGGAARIYGRQGGRAGMRHGAAPARARARRRSQDELVAAAAAADVAVYPTKKYWANPAPRRRGRRARGILLHRRGGHPPRHRRPSASVVRVGNDSCCGFSRHP